jgi:hybrid polyketide synthase/nonribosomal peptide synthetase ACE1
MQIFTAICFGGKVYLLPRRFRGDARAIGDAISHHGITHTYGTPSEYFSWLKYTEPEALRTSSWKTALVGGEFLARSLLKEFAALNKSDLRFLHMYGTTESTFCASVMELPYTQEASEDDNTKPNYPAGVALPNYTLYVLDEQMKPLPSGLQGEIAIGGAGVGFGYLNNPSLTDEKFVKDIFATDEDRARGWTMMQRTGDLGRWREDGAIFIEGRISGDTQVKLRGLRLDLREVENAMLHTSNGALNEVVVSVRRASPESPEFLVAHVVFDQSHAQEDHEQSIRLLRSRLELPQFMCPAFIIPVDRMPATASGKLDRKAVAALPLPEDNTSTEEIELTPTEERLKRVWEDVLSSDLAKIHRITPETDFFHVGGTSLLLLGLQEKIKVEFKVEITLVDLFELSVLSSMARKLEGESEKLEDIKWEEETVLTPAILELTKGPLHPVKHSNSKVVILTGGSGYLGKGLIRDLIADPTVKEIHCLGVRNAASRTEIIGLDKVSLYEGDLKQPRIGLSQEVIDDLFGRADLIIHNGADISYMKTYQSLRQSNALTTKELVEWSMPRMVPIHYISTAGIGMFAPGTPFGASSAARFPPPIDGSMGYTACKWVCSCFDLFSLS